MKERTSNTQLLALLSNLDAAARADHPLSAMFRAFVRDALLDLRDARGQVARLGWFVSNMERNVRWAKEECLKAQLGRRDESLNFLHEQRLPHIADLLNRADNEHPHDGLVSEAIAPLTGKEK